MKRDFELTVPSHDFEIHEIESLPPQYFARALVRKCLPLLTDKDKDELLARKAYLRFMARRDDPALAERDSGYSVRSYALTYVRPISAAPLPHREEIAEVWFDLETSGCTVDFRATSAEPPILAEVNKHRGFWAVCSLQTTLTEEEPGLLAAAAGDLCGLQEGYAEGYGYHNFLVACQAGHVDCVKWLAAKAHITAEEKLDGIAAAGCESLLVRPGCADVIKWLQQSSP